MRSTVEIGNNAEPFVLFTVDGVATDPTAVRLLAKGPTFGSSEVEYVFGVDSEIVQNATGDYEASFRMTTAGTHFFRWVGTGACVSALEVIVEVPKSNFDSPL